MATEKKTDVVILGLLCHEPLTGYEIKKILETRLSLFWNASYGSIYPTLNQLEAQGLVTKRHVCENGRKKIIYEITDNGRAELKEWLEKPVIKDELRYETLLKMFFGAEVGRMTTVSHINRFENGIRESLPHLHSSVEQLKQHPEEEAHKYYMLTALFGQMVYETYLDWCQKAKEILKEQ